MQRGSAGVGVHYKIFKRLQAGNLNKYLCGQ
jgi:hypothetical protein